MVLLAAEQQLGVREIAASVRECEATVRCWRKRYAAHGIAGLQDVWACAAPAKVTPAYWDQVLQLVRRRPRSLHLPSCTRTLQRLAEYLAEQTGIGVQTATVRVHLLAAASGLRRPQQTMSPPRSPGCREKETMEAPRDKRQAGAAC